MSITLSIRLSASAADRFSTASMIAALRSIAVTPRRSAAVREDCADYRVAHAALSHLEARTLRDLGFDSLADTRGVIAMRSWLQSTHQP